MSRITRTAVLCVSCDAYMYGADLDLLMVEDEVGNVDHEVLTELNGMLASWEPNILAEGFVTLNGEPIAKDELPSWLAGQNHNRAWYSHEPDPIPTMQVGGSSVVAGLGRWLADMSETDRVKRKVPLLWGFREPSHVRWDEVHSFAKVHPHAWHEVRDMFDRKPRWKK